MLRIKGVSWSPDGRWLAHGFALTERKTAIKPCELASGATHLVTEPILSDTRPAFDPGGRYLYFLGTRMFTPVADPLQFDLGFRHGVKPYLVLLQRDLRSPFVLEPRPDGAESSDTTGEEPSRKREQGTDEQQPPSHPQTVKIDLDGIT